MKQLSDIDVSGKRVFLRADLDVPLESVHEVHNGERDMGRDLSVEASTRLVNLKPTVEYLLSKQVKQIIIAGHIDRPTRPVPSLSTARLELPLEAILSRSVTFKPDFPTDETLASMAQLMLFENLRFWPGEEENDLDFAKQLSELADIYVNDSFATCHRVHASMVALPSLLPHAAGLHLAEEVKVLEGLLAAPKRPFVAVIGGVKIADKIPAIENLAKVADRVLVGGALPLEIVKEGISFPGEKVLVANLTADERDIDQASRDEFATVIAGAKTVVWNGPMGLFEDGHEMGTLKVAEAILASGANSIVGGGNTDQFLFEKDLRSQFSFVSSGGGAMLEFLAGRKLPGIAALE